MISLGFQNLFQKTIKEVKLPMTICNIKVYMSFIQDTLEDINLYGICTIEMQICMSFL